tara:strand:- start:327 stop:926 length:600 start_codon:yes stop_codon:yes gene_type:complete
MDDLLLFIIILCIFFSVLIFFNKNLFDKEVIRVKSSADGHTYLVRKLPNPEQAANLLAGYKKDIMKISERLKVKHTKDKYTDGVKRLFDNLRLQNLSECDPFHKYKSYSVNKGEELFICLRETDAHFSFSENNTIIFTICHELAHVCNITIGHPTEFWDWMKVILEAAEDIGLYTPIDYSQYPVNYCGMQINSTPYIFK